MNKISCALILAASSSLLGAATFTEIFDYADGALVGKGPWLQIGSTTTNPVTVSSDAISFVSSGQDVGAAVGFSSSVGTSIYAGFDLALSAALTGDYFFAFNTAATATNYAGRFFAKSSGAGYVLGLQMGATGAAPTYSSTVMTFAETYRIVIRYDSVTGTQAPGNDTGTFYIDPISGTEGSSTAAVGLVNWTGTSTDNAVLNSVAIRQGSNTAAPTVSVFDNLIVSTAFADAASVIPEPSTYATILGGIALVGVVATRRRRAQASS